METTSRQLKAARKEKKEFEKVESLQYTLDSLTRRCDDLEALVDANFSAVFMNRYRDSNPHIRALTISKLGTMCLARPDLYLRDRYLKYIGWTLSDKAAVVRIASLQALCAPFSDSTIDSAAMQNVISKFLSRLADCTTDIDVDVQQEAMTSPILGRFGR
jgi:cohesin complex subunit SA-1/2